MLQLLLEPTSLKYQLAMAISSLSTSPCLDIIPFGSPFTPYSFKDGDLHPSRDDRAVGHLHDGSRRYRCIAGLGCENSECAFYG